MNTGENNDLTAKIREFRSRIGGTGLTARQKKVGCEELLREFRLDRKEKRQLSEQESKKHRAYLRYVLALAEETLQREQR